MHLKMSPSKSVNLSRFVVRTVQMVLSLAICVSALAASTKPGKSPASLAIGPVSDHEVRRAKFQKLCANPSSSQRETLEIWAKGDGKKFGVEFCEEVEYKYFGTKERPKTWHSVAFNAADNVKDYSPIQYFGGIKHAGVAGPVTDLSPIANYTELETFSVADGKYTVDISVVSNFKNLKTLSLRNTQVVSLEPLKNLSKLEILNLHIDRHTGLPGRKGLESLRHLTSLRQLDMDVAEPLGDQLKDLQSLRSLVIYGPVKDVCSLGGLKQLSSLHLIRSGIRDISCLKNLKELVDITLQGNPITSVSGLAPLPKLMNLTVSDTLIEDLSALTGNPNMYILEADNAPLRWCSPKSAEDIKKGVSCLNADGTEKPWWKRMLRL